MRTTHGAGQARTEASGFGHPSSQLHQRGWGWRQQCDTWVSTSQGLSEWDRSLKESMSSVMAAQQLPNTGYILEKLVNVAFLQEPLKGIPLPPKYRQAAGSRTDAGKR